MYTRNCPLCSTEIQYSCRTSFRRACKLNGNCKSCSTKMKKSLKTKKLISASQKKRFENQEEKNKVSKRQKKYWSDPTVRKIQSEKLKGKMAGNKNPFFGKTHTAESIEKMKKAQTTMDRSQWQTKQFREKMSKLTSGINNANYGISNHQRWVKKYGKSKADELEKKRIEKMANTLKGRPGNPPPHGAGNGWSGWYKGWFFRSLHELSYMIKVIEANNFKWISAECSALKVGYVDQSGQPHNYFADFFLNENTLVEVKPIRLRSLKLVELKRKAAEQFCKEKGYKYLIDSCEILSEQELQNLYKKGLLKFTRKYQEIFDNKNYKIRKNPQ